MESDSDLLGMTFSVRAFAMADLDPMTVAYLTRGIFVVHLRSLIN